MNFFTLITTVFTTIINLCVTDRLITGVLQFLIYKLRLFQVSIGVVIPVIREAHLHTILDFLVRTCILLIEVKETTGDKTTREKCGSVLCEKTRLLSLGSGFS